MLSLFLLWRCGNEDDEEEEEDEDTDEREVSRAREFIMGKKSVHITQHTCMFSFILFPLLYNSDVI